MTSLPHFLVVSICLVICQTTTSQSIGYGMPNFGLLYNPYTSPAWGYGMGPQYSSVRGSLAYGLLGGPAAFGGMGYGGGMPGMGGMIGGIPALSMLGGFGGAGMPYGPYAGYAQPGLLSGQYNFLGPYGRYPGSTGSLGYGSQQGYAVYNGYGMYPGIGGLPGYAGDYDHYGTPWGMGSRDIIQASQPIPGVRTTNGFEQFGLVGPGGANSVQFPPNFRGDPTSSASQTQLPPFRGDISRLPQPNHFEGDGHGRMGIKDSDTSASSSLTVSA